MSYSKIPAGKDLPNDIYVAIEIPANHAPIKYEIDKDSDTLFVDRFMATPMFYPANYGFIPNTLADDGDPLDVLVVTPYPVAPGSVIRARPVGVLNMTDDGGGDEGVSFPAAFASSGDATSATRKVAVVRMRVTRGGVTSLSGTSVGVARVMAPVSCRVAWT